MFYPADTVRTNFLRRLILIVPTTFNERTAAIAFCFVPISKLSNCFGPFVAGPARPTTPAPGRPSFVFPRRPRRVERKKRWQKKKKKQKKKRKKFLSCSVLESLAISRESPRHSSRPVPRPVHTTVNHSRRWRPLPVLRTYLYRRFVRTLYILQYRLDTDDDNDDNNITAGCRVLPRSCRKKNLI